MRVVIVSQHYPPENSGNASRVSDMARHMARQGVDVTVVAPHPSFPTGRFSPSWRWSRTRTEEGVRVVNLLSWQPRRADPHFFSRILYYLTFPLHATLWALVHLRKYDVIVGSTPPVFTSLAGWVVSFVSRRKTFVVEVRDLWIDAAVSLGFVKEKSALTRLSRRFEQSCYRRARLVGCTTDDAASKIAARAPGVARITVVPNGVDVERMQTASRERRPQFVYAGNIGHAQDFETLLRAFKIAVQQHPEARLVLAGDGDVRTTASALAKQLEIEDKVSFPGILPRSAIPALYAESLAGVAPLKRLASLEYAVPTKAYEYLAAGLPFLGLGIGEIARLADASGGGIVPDSTPEALAVAMVSLLRDPAKAAELGRAGKEYVAKRYDRAQITARYLADLEAVHAAAR